MKRHIKSLLWLVAICCFIIAGCGKDGQVKDGIKVYPVNITKVSPTKDGDLYVTGTTKAPKGAKVFA